MTALTGGTGSGGKSSLFLERDGSLHLILPIASRFTTLQTPIKDPLPLLLLHFLPEQAQGSRRGVGDCH